MNEETNEKNAITGEATVQPAEKVDWKQKYDELERKYASARVEEGRVRKMDEELKARDKIIEELRASKRAEEIANSLTEDEKGDIPDDYLKVTARLVNNGMARMQAENDRKFDEMRAQREAENEELHKSAVASFNRRIDAQYPKFRNSIGPGGDKADAWSTYLRYNKASVVAAYNEGDFETLAHHIETFYRDHLGIPVPSAGQDGSAAPDPANQGGGATGLSAGHGKVYTSEEFIGLYDRIEEARSKGDYAEIRRLEAEIKSAPAEGRVK